MKVTIKGIIKENKEEKFISKLVKHITLPYFYNLNMVDVPELLWDRILSKKFNQEVRVESRVESYGRYSNVFNSSGNLIYYETSDGYWEKREYDLNGKEIYYETSDGYWEKQEYDLNGNEIYYETSVGYWVKKEYDNLLNGNLIYSEDSDGSWEKLEYDLNGNLIYYEDSDGEIIDRRNINESFNINPQKYCDKIIDKVISETEYYVFKPDNVRVTFPMYDYSYEFTLDEINEWINSSTDWFTPSTDDIEYFSKSYGLNTDETKYVMNEVLSFIGPIIYQKMVKVDI